MITMMRFVCLVLISISFCSFVYSLSYTSHNATGSNIPDNDTPYNDITGIYSRSHVTQECSLAIFDTINMLLETNAHPIPRSAKEKIVAHPQDFFSQLTELADDPLLVLVDKQHPLSESMIPLELTPLDEYSDTLALSKTGMFLTKQTITALRSMNSVAQADGVTLLISSAYRSFSYQKRLFNYYVQTIGLEQAFRESAEAGKSQHQLGTTVDFGSISSEFTNSKPELWLRERAAEFGFSLSYPPSYEAITGYVYESWHYRYLGQKALLFQKQYFADIQQYMLETIHSHNKLITSSKEYKQNYNISKKCYATY